MNKHTPDALTTAQFIVMVPSVESFIVLGCVEVRDMHLLAHPDNNVEGSEPQYRC